MAYATVAEVQARLANNNLGVSGGTIVDDTQLSEMIDEATFMINDYLDVTTDVTDPAYTGILKKICIDLVNMMIIQARIGKQTNDPTQVQNFWSTNPDFTNGHIRSLNKIRDRLRSRSAYAYNVHTGERVI